MHALLGFSFTMLSSIYRTLSISQYDWFTNRTDTQVNNYQYYVMYMWCVDTVVDYSSLCNIDIITVR